LNNFTNSADIKLKISSTNETSVASFQLHIFFLDLADVLSNYYSILPQHHSPNSSCLHHSRNMNSCDTSDWLFMVFIGASNSLSSLLKLQWDSSHRWTMESKLLWFINVIFEECKSLFGCRSCHFSMHEIETCFL